jgi:histidinol phosphatase-like enzyme
MTLYIFDKDGTLTNTKSGGVCPNYVDDMFILPNVKEKLTSLACDENEFGIATNQGGVSFGYMTEMETWDIIRECDNLLGNIFKYYAVSFYHSNGRYKEFYLDKAKPRSTLLIEILSRAQEEIRNAVYIGDGFGDEEAATSLGMDFCWAHDFFDWGEENIKETSFGFQPTFTFGE